METQKKYQLEQFLKSKMVNIYPSPDAQVIKTKCMKPTKPALQKVIRVALNAQPVKEEIEAIVSLSDGRLEVLNTAKWPNSVHGVLVGKFNKMTFWGTGILIGPNIVLTSGHNLYSHHSKAYAELKSLQFLPGMHGQMLPFGLVEVEQYYVSPNFIKEEKENYGILILKESIGEITGHFGLACLEPEEIKSKRINVTGYPGDKVASKSNFYEMWGMEGTASHIDEDKGEINYLIDTAEGQAGSGVWYQEGEDYYVCGVHVMGGMIANTATLLTRAIYRQIYNWLSQDPNCKWILALDGIEKLEFEDFQIDAEHLSFLIEYDLKGLTTLSLISKKIGPKGAEILARSTSWANLSMLDLYNNQIGSEGCKALAQNTSWVNLSWLNLNRNNIGTEGVRGLARNTSWTNLSKLSLENNNIEPGGAQALTQNSSWEKLSWLSLKTNLIGDQGARELAQNTVWTNLKFLDLRDNEVENGEETANILRQNPNWLNLESLDL